MATELAPRRTRLARVLPVLLLVAGVVMSGSGCLNLRAPFVPYAGTALNDTSFPIDTTYEEAAIGPLRGSSTAYSAFFGLFAWGDCSVVSAARDGNIEVVNHVDARLFNFLTLYTKFETIVHGSRLSDQEHERRRSTEGRAGT